MTEKQVTTYLGFSKVKGTMSIPELVNAIRSEKYNRIITRIRYLRDLGNTDEMNRVKRQLEFFTVTTQYGTHRKPDGIIRYNNLITIDIDGLTDEQVIRLRPVIEADPATIFSFLTAKQHGFKIIAYLETAAIRELRKTFCYMPEMTYEQLETYHAQAYELTRTHYENVLNVPVDTSGKDLSRGIFASYDPDAFFSPERLEKASSFSFPDIIAPPPTRKGRKKQTVDPSCEVPTSVDDTPPPVRMEYRKCVACTKRSIQYAEGSYNTFLFTLGNKCCRKGLDLSYVRMLAAEEFGANGQWDTHTPISNGYTYNDHPAKTPVEKVPPINQVLNYLDEHYEFRRNSILDRLEMKLSRSEKDKNDSFRAMCNKDFNTIFLRINQAGIPASQQVIKSIIDSDYAEQYDPIATYFRNLPPWDGKTDYIGQLAQTIETDEPDFWEDALRRWITGMVACGMGIQEANQQVLLLHGSQGKGKSTWIRQLMPPELKEYYRNGMIDPGNKDDLLLLATRLLINMEEFEGVKQNNIAELKRIIALETITIRKPYEVQAQPYPRRASFIGSTNNLQFLKDITGSRRFLVISTRQINYRDKIDHTGLYSQAKHLVDSGFRYWFEGEEVESINERNEKHRIKDPVEENLYVYFRRATRKDIEVKWKPAAAILSLLSVHGRTIANAQSQQILVHVLERDNFRKRRNKQGITEYGVIVLSLEEIDQNMRKLEEKPQEETGELPF